MNVEREPILIGQTEDIELDTVENFEYEEEVYAIYNLASGFYATQGSCSCENDVHLSEGIINNEEIECQICGKIFSIVSGDCISNPEDKSLKVYDISIEENSLYLNI